MESLSIEAKVLSAVKSSVSMWKAGNITLQTLLKTEALIGPDEFHGIIHDLTGEIEFPLSSEEADDFYQTNPTVSGLAALIASKVQELRGK